MRLRVNIWVGCAAGLVANGGLEDIEILAATDAMPLEPDQNIDDDFYEWAAGEA